MNQGLLPVRPSNAFANFIIQRFGYETGKEAQRDSGETEIYMRKAYEVGVGIYHNAKSKRGYSIYTTYPYNRRAQKDK